MTRQVAAAGPGVFAVGDVRSGSAGYGVMETGQ